MKIFSMMTDPTISDSLLWTGCEIAVKSFVVASLVCLALRILRSSSASRRHLVCAVGVGAVLVIPIGVLAFPAWNILPELRPTTFQMADHLRSPSTSADESESTFQADESATGSHPFSESSLPTNTSVLKTASQSGSEWQVLSVGSIMLAAWALVAGALLFPILRSLVSLKIQASRCEPFQDQRINRLLHEQASLLETPPPTLLAGAEHALPMVWGIFQCQMILPKNATQWSDKKLVHVLFHELAHLKRFDPLTMLLGPITRALHWFNPLVWYLNRQLVIEQEGACDDQVINQFNDGPSYAETLLEIATTSQELSVVSSASVAMARPLQIEKRLRAILNPQNNRLPASLTHIVVTSCIAMGLSGLFASLSASPIESSPTTAPQQEDANDTELAAKNESLAKAVQYLQSVQREDGSFPSLRGSAMETGSSALGAIALIHADDFSDEECRNKAIQAAAERRPTTTYGYALKVIALCQSGEEGYADLIKESIDILVDSQAKAGRYLGGWSYTKNPNRADGSNTRFAIWALAVAVEHEYEVPADCLENAAQYWINMKIAAGGGWTYVGNGGAPRTVTMTLSGIACLSWLKPTLPEDSPLHDEIDEAIVEAWNLGGFEEGLKNEKGWPYYAWHLYRMAVEATDRNLEGLELDGLLTQEEINEILAELQNEDGSFALDREGFDSIVTCMAILAMQ